VLSCRAVALFLQGLTLGLSAAAQPGPFQAYLLAQSVKNGAVRTLPVALVPLVSDPPVVATVLAVLAQVPAGLLRVLQIAGGAIVLWLGVGVLRAARAGSVARADEGRPGAPRGFWRAVLVNLTNPNAWIGWSVVMGPIASAAWRGSPARALAFVAGFYLFLVGGNVLLVLLAARASRLGPGFARALGVASGVALLGFGLWQVGRAIA
jgi:threonine/homoserine/homoserine lactone efflux protein